jgi:Ca-activated chloride channel homolog
MHRATVLQSLASAVLIVLTPLSLVGAEATRRNSAAITVGPSADRAAVNLKVNSDLVEIPVTVMDKADQAVEHLSSEMFLIYENGVQQTIVHFETAEAPISACVVFDSSLSMAPKLRQAVEAVRALLNAAISDDEYCLVRFSDQPEVMVRMSSGPQGVAAAMNRIYAGGWTALLDAIYVGMQEAKRGHNRRKAIVLISDGGDNRSRHTRRDIKQSAREADTQIYSLGIGTPDALLANPEEIDGPSLMKDISHQSGGRLFRIHRMDNLASAIGKINAALRHQYVLGYYPKEDRHDGKYRRVTIKLNAPKMTSGLRAYWRAGYYAPQE